MLSVQSLVKGKMTAVQVFVHTREPLSPNGITGGTAVKQQLNKKPKTILHFVHILATTHTNAFKYLTNIKIFLIIAQISWGVICLCLVVDHGGKKLKCGPQDMTCLLSPAW